MKKTKIPRPISGGLMLSYKWPVECRHCMYACSPKQAGDWITVLSSNNFCRSWQK